MAPAVLLPQALARGCPGVLETRPYRRVPVGSLGDMGHGAGMLCSVVEPSAKAIWVQGLLVGDPLKDELGRLVEADHDEAELAYYEAAADPTLVRLERERRRYRGMFRRRLRH